MSISSRVEDITSLQESDSSRLAKYNGLLREIPLTADNDNQIEEFVTAVLRIPYGTSLIRDILSNLLSGVKPDPKDDDFEKRTLKFLLAEIQPQIASFGAVDIALRNKLVDILEQEGENIEAARILEDAFLRTDRKILTEDEQFDWYIRIVRNRLEADDSTVAEQYLSKAALIRPRTKNPSAESLTHFRLSQARILDSNRKFLDAARKYYEVSTISEVQIDDEDRLACLSASITCAVLAPAGPMRSQVLRLIYNDDRSRLTPDFDMLEKVYMGRLLMPGDVENFGRQLAPHQMVQLPDGVTVLSRAVFDHNLLSVSRLYNNIKFSELSKIMALDKTKVEAYAAKMISQGRLKAAIDQVDDLIVFTSTSDTFKLVQWENRIEHLCSNLEDLVSDIGKRHPELC